MSPRGAFNDDTPRAFWTFNPDGEAVKVWRYSSNNVDRTIVYNGIRIPNEALTAWRRKYNQLADGQDYRWTLNTVAKRTPFAFDPAGNRIVA